MIRLVVTIAFVMQAAVALGGEVMESSYVLPDGQRVLRHEVLVDARAEELWKAWPADPSSEVVSYLPNEMLSLRHPHLAKKVFTVIEFVRIEDPSTTRVRVSMLPYGRGAEWDAVYDKFRAANAEMLRKLEEKHRK